MLTKLTDYFRENPVFLYVIVAFVAVAVIAIVALSVKASKSKKNAAAVAPNVGTEPEEKDEATSEEKTEATPEEKAVIEEKTETEEPSEESTGETEPIKEESSEEPSEESTGETEPIKEETAEEPSGKATSPSEYSEREEKNQPKAEKEEKKTKKSRAEGSAEKKTATSAKTNRPSKAAGNAAGGNAEEKYGRYSGKWVICRLVVPAGKDSAEIKEPEEEAYFFELRASNGEKLLTSEEYTTYNGALGGISTHKANILSGNFKIMLSKKGDYIFKLLNGKNMLLCMGEHYATRARCESAIESTKRFAKTAVVDENVQDIVVPLSDEETAEETAAPAEGYEGKWIISGNVGEDGEQVFYFELFASNGEKLLSSEEYTTYIGAVNGIGTYKANIAKDNFRISLTKQGDYIYKLLNGNKQLLCLGEHYKTRRRCQSAIESVKRFAKNAPILTDEKTANK